MNNAAVVGTPFDQHHTQYLESGYALFRQDEKLMQWVDTSINAARKTLSAEENSHWLRHGGTWFAGVNVLPNDPLGKVANGIPLQGLASQFIESVLRANIKALDKAQVSVCYPSYPQPSSDESSGAFGYRLRRDAAHIDGLLREPSQSGDVQERYIREHHDYILGIAMTQASANAAPFVVWPESHKLVFEHFQRVLRHIPPSEWRNFPIAESYQQLRRRIFSECERVEVPLKPGDAIVAHRLLLHGTAPWSENAKADSDGRMICFFRPSNIEADQWLSLS